MNTKQLLIASPILCAINAEDAIADAFALHWSVRHPNGTLLAADTKFPMKDGAAALIAGGWAVDTDDIALVLEEAGRYTTSEPVVIALVLAEAESDTASEPDAAAPEADAQAGASE